MQWVSLFRGHGGPLLILPLLLMSCASSHEGFTEVTLSSPEKTYTLWVEIADDPPEQAQGLMGRTEMPHDRGMLFIFPKEQPLSFWMKNTLIPLDILFFDADGNFVSYQSMDPCKADPCKTYPSAGRAKYALEVQAGFIEKEGVGEGWRMSGAGL